MSKITSFRDLRVYQQALDGVKEVFAITSLFPETERRRLTDQIIRASGSVCANLAEAWRRRRYRAAFIAKLNEVETEASEVQSWLDVAERFGYISPEQKQGVDARYESIIKQIVVLINQPEKWILPPAK